MRKLSVFCFGGKMEEKREEKREDPGKIGKSSRFIRWLDNYWYHYKWHTIIVAFFLTVLIVTLVQCSSNKSADLFVTFGGAGSFSQTEREEIKKTLDAILPEDYNEDGNKNVTFVRYTVYSEEELKALYTSKNPETGENTLDTSAYSGGVNQNRGEIEQFATYSKTGECSLWFVSPYLYDSLNLSYLSVKNGKEEEAVLGETDFYRYYDALQLLPPDTLIILTKNLFTEDTVFERAKATYEAILSFEKP